MKKLVIAFVASAATFAMASVATAGELVTLTDAELDSVTAAGAFVSADLRGDAIVNGSFFLNNLPGEFSVAQISANVRPISGVVMLALTARANTFN